MEHAVFSFCVGGHSHPWREIPLRPSGARFAYHVLNFAAAAGYSATRNAPDRNSCQPFRLACQSRFRTHQNPRLSVVHEARRMEDSEIHSLISRVRHGDGQARDQLFQMCRAQLRGWATTTHDSQLLPEWDPSDAVQESLTEASRDFDAFRGQDAEQLFAWLRRILQHTVADRVRFQNRSKRNSGRQQTLDDVLAGDPGRRQNPANDQSSISRRVIRKEEQQQVQAMLRQLHGDQATAARLRHLDDLSVDEIAGRMNRSRASVAGLLIRAMRHLRELMDPEV